MINSLPFEYAEDALEFCDKHKYWFFTTLGNNWKKWAKTERWVKIVKKGKNGQKREMTGKDRENWAKMTTNFTKGGKLGQNSEKILAG